MKDECGYCLKYVTLAIKALKIIVALLNVILQGRVVENLSRRCGGFLKHLSLEGCENVDDKTLRIFSQNCQNLSELILVKCKKISDQ